ncbi:hypothetical protein [Streptomyces sp. KL116D]|uniref:hypothetical protein n=1 Tax=Streptomyces sp. KL116D TaxID=3045152 RepID=UPI003556E6B6
MTERHAADDEQVHRRLQAPLEKALDGLLDVEAGLSEVLLSSRHEAAVDALETVVDTEAGLVAILPAEADPPPRPDLAAAEQPLHDLSAAQRLALRSNPTVRAASEALARDIERGHALVRSLDHALVRAHILVRNLDRARDRDLDRAHDVVRDPERARDRAIARDSARDLAIAIERVYGFNRTLVGDLVQDLDFDLDRDLDLDYDLDRDLADACDLALALARDLEPGLDRDFDSARALARGFCIYLDRTLGREGDLVAAVIGARTNWLGRAIGQALGRPAPAWGHNAAAVLNDFTADDLTGVDLTGVDLGGIRWSESGTRWPSTVNVDAVKARSDETRPGSGTWVVRSGSTSAHEFVGL